MIYHGNHAIDCPGANGRCLGLCRIVACLAFLFWFSALTAFADVTPVSHWGGSVVLRQQYPGGDTYQDSLRSFTSVGATDIIVIGAWSGYFFPNPPLWDGYYDGYIFIIFWRGREATNWHTVYYASVVLPNTVGTSAITSSWAAAHINFTDNTVDFSDFAVEKICFNGTAISGGGVITGTGTYLCCQPSGETYYNPVSTGSIYCQFSATIIVDTWLTVYYQGFDPGTMASPTMTSTDQEQMPAINSGAEGKYLVDFEGTHTQDSALVADFDTGAGVANNNGFSGITGYLTSTSSGGVSVSWDGANINGIIPEMEFDLPTSITLSFPCIDIYGNSSTISETLSFTALRDGLAGVRVAMTLAVSLFTAFSIVSSVMATFKYHPGA